MGDNKKKYTSAGAVWSNKSKSGKTFYNGHIEFTVDGEVRKIYVVGFPKKKGDPANWPALRLYVDDSRDPKTGKRVDGKGGKPNDADSEQPIGDNEEDYV